MKTLSAVSRKVHSNVLSLALQLPELCNAISHYRGAVLRQDVRISGGYLSAGFAWPKSAPGHGERERHRSRFAKGTGEEIGCSVPGMHSAPNPRRIRRKSVNETVARLLLAGATFLMALSRTLEDSLVLSDMKAPSPEGFGADDGKYSAASMTLPRSRKLPFILSFRPTTRGQKERLNVCFVRHGHGIGDALVIFRYRVDPTNGEVGGKV